MATLMITGGKVGTILGRRRAFAIGLVIYGCGSLVTALAPNLGVLLLGWSLLEGVGAALIMPAIVALVAANFAPAARTSAYGLIAAAGAMAVAAGPLIGGAVTTFGSWRYVFFGEVVVVGLILLLLRRMADVPPVKVRLDLVGSALSVLGLGSLVYGVLKSSEWGWVEPKPGGPAIFGVSPTTWLILGGLAVVYGFLQWESRLEAADREPLLRPTMLRNRQLTGGLTLFGTQFAVQSGVFFAVPLFLSVVLGLSALQTGIRVFPLSVALLLAAAGIPRVWPGANPRRVVRLGLVLVVAGILILVAGLDPGVNASVVAIPMILLGLGLGALSSQLGAVTVSSVSDEDSAEVGGLQNTATNLGASLGTALIGSVLIATLSTAVLAGIQSNPDVPSTVKEQATVQLAAGVPFLSDADLTAALDQAGVPPATVQDLVDLNSDARLEALRTALALAAAIALLALFPTRRLPTRAPGTVSGTVSGTVPAAEV